MKILKTLSIVIVVLIAIPLIIALFIPKNYTIEREIIINKPRAEVFNYIKYLKNQENFSVWMMMDPKMKKSYKGTDGTLGFICSWDSKNKKVGKAEQEIVKIVEGEGIETKLRFTVPLKAEDEAYIISEDAENFTTKVKWGFTGSFPYPMNILLLMDMDKEIGENLTAGLQNLKKVLEK